MLQKARGEAIDEEYFRYLSHEYLVLKHLESLDEREAIGQRQASRAAALVTAAIASIMDSMGVSDFPDAASGPVRASGPGVIPIRFSAGGVAYRFEPYQFPEYFQIMEARDAQLPWTPGLSAAARRRAAEALALLDEELAED